MHSCADDSSSELWAQRETRHQPVHPLAHHKQVCFSACTDQAMPNTALHWTQCATVWFSSSQNCVTVRIQHWGLPDEDQGCKVPTNSTACSLGDFASNTQCHHTFRASITTSYMHVQHTLAIKLTVHHEHDAQIPAHTKPPGTSLTPHSTRYALWSSKELQHTQTHINSHRMLHYTFRAAMRDTLGCWLLTGC